jgi:hypothetical protein
MASPVDIASIFKRKGQTPTPETQAPSQGSSIIRSFFVREGIEEKRNAEQRNKNKAFASGRPATIFSQPESSNIKIKKPTLGSGS